jgi:hypothetical protein
MYILHEATMLNIRTDFLCSATTIHTINELLSNFHGPMQLQKCIKNLQFHFYKGLHGGDRMVVGFSTTYAISAYHH